MLQSELLAVALQTARQRVTCFCLQMRYLQSSNLNICCRQSLLQLSDSCVHFSNLCFKLSNTLLCCSQGCLQLPCNNQLCPVMDCAGADTWYRCKNTQSIRCSTWTSHDQKQKPFKSSVQAHTYGMQHLCHCAACYVVLHYIAWSFIPQTCAICEPSVSCDFDLFCLQHWQGPRLCLPGPQTPGSAPLASPLSDPMHSE